MIRNVVVGRLKEMFAPISALVERVQFRLP